MPSYTCPNPSCGVSLKTANQVAPGKKVKCPKCGDAFVAEPVESAPKAATGPGTFKFADGESGKKPSPPPPPAPPPSRFHEEEEDEESVKKGYGVVKETEEELKQAEKHKPKFSEVQDKFKKSARGPAMAMLVMPTNLLIVQGLITAIGGLGQFVVGMWPIVFNEGALGDEEVEEAIVRMILGMITFGWGCMICYGASQMQELASYSMAMGGAILGILPFGIFALIMLQKPEVKAGFEESEGGPDEDEEKDEDDEDDDDDEKGKKKKKKRNKDDDDDEEEEEEEDEDDDD